MPHQADQLHINPSNIFIDFFVSKVCFCIPASFFQWEVSQCLLFRPPYNWLKISEEDQEKGMFIFNWPNLYILYFLYQEL